MTVKTKCGACGKPLGSGETVHVAGDGPRCYPCFNRETADRLGIDFAEPQFHSLVLEDAEGAPHTFKFRSMLVPTGHEIEALEIPTVISACRWSSSTARRLRRSRSVTWS
jgi:hypothetical protein